MSEKSTEQDKLRKAAEAKLTYAPDTKQMPRPAEKLLHELRVHQIELEMQNEQLRQSQLELEKSRDRYVDFYDFAPVGYLTLNHEGMIDEINLTGAALLGVERNKLPYHRFAYYIAPEDRDNWHRHFLFALKSDNKHSCELLLQHDNEPRFYAGLDCLRLKKDGKEPVVRVVLTDITDRKQAETALREKDHVLTESQRIAHVGSWHFDLMTGKLSWSDETYHIYGVSPDTFTPNAESLLGLILPDYRPAMQTWIGACAAGKSPAPLEFRINWPDGNVHILSGYGEVRYDAWNKASHLIGIVQDITERKQAEAELRIAAAAFESQDGIMVTNPQNVILRINHAFTEITGYTAEEAVGQTPRLISSKRHDAAFYAAMWESIKRIGAWQGEIWNRRKNGDVFPERLTIHAVKGDTGEITHYVAMMHDITVRKQADEQIRALAFYDTLTQLPNRRLLNDRLEQAMVASKRSGRYGALMFMDMDNFKPLNDAHGHDVGDLLLVEVAHRISSCVREVDTVARFGGDEFVVVLRELDVDKAESITQASIVAEKIRATLAEPYVFKIQHEGKAETTIEHHCTSSVGVVLFINHEASAEDILKWADIAMYQAKEAGRNLIRFYEPKA